MKRQLPAENRVLKKRVQKASGRTLTSRLLLLIDRPLQVDAHPLLRMWCSFFSVSLLGFPPPPPPSMHHRSIAACALIGWPSRRATRLCRRVPGALSSCHRPHSHTASFPPWWGKVHGSCRRKTRAAAFPRAHRGGWSATATGLQSSPLKNTRECRRAAQSLTAK